MPLFKSRFRRAFDAMVARHSLGRVRAQADPLCEDLVSTMSTVDCGTSLFRIDEDQLGQLAALILIQAESNGCSRVQFRFARNRMVFTICGGDHDMVPMVSPGDADLARMLCKEAGTSMHEGGALDLDFKDGRIRLAVSFEFDPEGYEPFVEVRGFSELNAPQATGEATEKSNAVADSDPAGAPA